MTVERIDAPGTTCSLASLECSQHLTGAGGFDLHHEYPLSMGGAADQATMLTLCPNHHRRQHSLIRYLVELAGRPADHRVMSRFTVAEQRAALTAIGNWQLAGSPPIDGWPCPAARPLP
jgi:hypothetical protein